MGVHGTSVAFTKWQWPPLEDWPEFGHLLGARGANHRGGYLQEPIVMGLDDPAHPLLKSFGGKAYPWVDEIFRFHDPYSRKNVRVLLSIDTDKTDLSTYKPGDSCLRADNDYALAWVRNYGKGRVFYSALAHSPHVFEDARMLQFYLDGAQFVLGDLPAPTTPSAFLTPAAMAQEKLGWRIGIEAYTFHKYTFFEAIEKTAELGLPFIGGLSFMQQVSKDIPKHFDHNLSDDELRQIRFKLESAGVRMPVYYAQTIPFDEAACRKLFDFGNKMGVETFICEPKAEQLDLLDTLAGEYAINIGIHNHGPDISPHLWRPEMVLALCEGRSKRIGAAPDLGYWLRLGIDPIDAVRILKDRILTVQMHDLNEQGPNGHDVPWGSGSGKSRAFFEELHRQGIRPTMIGLEYSRDWLESMPKLIECIDFFNDTTLELAAHP
jgi:sugar phosphate isomerase/epimerase